MYKEIYRELIYPLYNYYKDSVHKTVDYQFFDYKAYYAVTHKEDIKSKYILQRIVDEGIVLKDYDLVIHIPYTKDMFTKEKELTLTFLLNDKPLQKEDYHCIIINEYLYIYLKKHITSVSNLAIFKFKTNVKIDEDITRYSENEDYGISPKFIEEYNNKRYLITYKDAKYIRLTKDKDSIKSYLDTSVSYWSYFKQLKIKSIKIYSKTKGFLDYDKDDVLLSYPGYVKFNKSSTKADDYEIYIFYEGLNPQEFTGSKYDKQYDELNDEEFLLDRMMYLDEKHKVIENENLLEYLNNMIEATIMKNEPENDLHLMRHIMNFNYDLFILLYRRLHRVNMGISCNDFIYVNKTDYNGVVSYENIKDGELDPRMNRFFKFTFINFKRLPFEIYHNYRKYTDTIFTEHKGYITVVYIPARSFVRHYGYTTTSDLTDKFINIVLRPAESKEIFVNNITAEYQGVMIPSRKFMYETKQRELYDNGYPIYESDIEYNTLNPTNVLVAFPQKKVYPHEINCLIYPSHFVKTSNTYKVKYRNLTNQDKDDFKNTNFKYIVNNHLYVDYIDCTYLLKIGPYILTENIDYIILSPNCIKFLKIPVIDDNDYLNITLEVQGKPYKELIRLSNKSFAKRFISSNTYKNTLTEDNVNIEKVFYPDNYDVKINRWHQMMTKYFSTELAIDLHDSSIYGEKWYSKISEEFPDFFKEVNGKTILDLSVEFDIKKREDFPRIVALPEINSLTALLSRHLLAISYLNDYGYTNGRTSYIDLTKVRKNKKYLSNFKRIDMDMAYGYIDYNCNIPLDVVIIDDI